jgi:hypothetical protein
MILDAKYMNLQNDHVVAKLANGTVGRLQGINLLPAARIRQEAVASAAGAMVHAVYASEVQALIFKHDTQAFKTSNFFPELPAGCFPVEPSTSRKKFSFGGGSTVTARVTQFNITLACVLTGHKMQGQSVDSVILGDLLGSHKYGATGWLYVVLSRVRTLGGLYTLQLLDEDVSKYKRRATVIREMERLRVLGTKTENRLARALSDGTVRSFVNVHGLIPVRPHRDSTVCNKEKSSSSTTLPPPSSPSLLVDEHATPASKGFARRRKPKRESRATVGREVRGTSATATPNHLLHVANESRAEGQNDWSPMNSTAARHTEGFQRMTVLASTYI